MPPFLCIATFSTTHHHAIKAAKTALMARPSKRQLAGLSNQIKKARIEVERELEAQAAASSLLQSEEATRPPSESDEESDLEVSDSKNESDVEFNQ